MMLSRSFAGRGGLALRTSFYAAQTIQAYTGKHIPSFPMSTHSNFFFGKIFSVSQKNNVTHSLNSLTHATNNLTRSVYWQPKV